MGRSKTNVQRGKQKGAVPPVPKLGTGQLVSTYDGRENLAAGKYERRADNDSEKDGHTVEWRK